MSGLASAAFLLVSVLFPAALAAADQASRLRPIGLGVLDSIVQEAIRDGQIPGAVVLVGHDGQVIYRKAFGERSLEPRREAMTVDTIFDLASLTKVVATTTAVMQLVEKGQIRVNDPVAKYIPEFAQNGKEEITVRELLTHYSGLPEDLDLTQPWQGRETAVRMAYEEKPVYAAGLAISVQRHQLHCAGRAGGARVRNVAGRVLPEEYLRAAEDDAHALSSARRLAAEDCAHAI